MPLNYIEKAALFWGIVIPAIIVIWSVVALIGWSFYDYLKHKY